MNKLLQMYFRFDMYVRGITITHIPLLISHKKQSMKNYVINNLIGSKVTYCIYRKTLMISCFYYYALREM